MPCLSKITIHHIMSVDMWWRFNHMLRVMKRLTVAQINRWNQFSFKTDLNDFSKSTCWAMIISQDFAVGRDVTRSLLAAFGMTSDGLAWGMSQFNASSGTVVTLGRFTTGWWVAVRSNHPLQGERSQQITIVSCRLFFKGYFFYNYHCFVFSPKVQYVELSPLGIFCSQTHGSKFLL